MKHIILGGILGGIVLFVWSFLAWVILPLHEPTLHKIANEDAVISVLKSNLSENAVYVLRKRPDMSGGEAAMNEWVEKVKQGPGGLIVYSPTGSDPMMPGQMVVGAILDILAATIVSWFLSRSTAHGASYIARVAYCCMFGIFLSVFDHLMNWNWVGFASDFTRGLIVDAILSWFLAGLVISAVVKLKKEAVA